jgi:hypothetical protein
LGQKNPFLFFSSSLLTLSFRYFCFYLFSFQLLPLPFLPQLATLASAGAGVGHLLLLLQKGRKDLNKDPSKARKTSKKSKRSKEKK